MLRNYLVVALRSVRRSPAYSMLNVAGLSVGIAACLLIMLFVRDELSYDRMHADADRIYRVVETRSSADGSIQDYVYTMGPLGPAVERSIPDVATTVRAVSRAYYGRRVVQRGDARFYVGDHLFAEPGFFDLFDFEFILGNAAGAIDEPREIVLSAEAAARYFGSRDPIGQSVAVEGIGDVTVTGVVRIPENTHVEYSMFLSFATLLNFDGWRNWLEDDWTSSGVITYLLLEPGGDADAVASGIRHLVEERANQDQEVWETRTPYLQALTDIHLGSSHIEFDEHAEQGRPIYLYLFSVVAVFVVLIAAMNYMNMATVRSIRRAREIGLRKVVGARRSQLVGQFLAESLLTTVVAVAGGLLLARLALPVFNDLAAKTLELTVSGPIAAGALILVLAVGLTAGAYPALYLSRFKPIAVLRGTAGTRPGKASVHKGFVVAQFAMSIALIIATLVVHDQLRYVQTKELGFEESHLVVIDINDGGVRSRYETVMDAFSAVPGVEAVSTSNSVPGDWKTMMRVDAMVVGSGPPDAVTAHFLGVDERFLDTYGIDLLEGRNFGAGFGGDSTSMLINRAAAVQLGAEVGGRIEIPEAGYAATVVGIVDDFHFRSLHQAIGPLLLGYHSNPVDVIDYFTVRLNAAGVSGTIAGLRAVGERFDPAHPFELNFLDERLADFYTREDRVRQIFAAAAMLAVLVACLGLFGLAAYTSERRTKEIGIRKALGATTAGVAALLTTDFAKLVVLAFVVSAPLTYAAMRWWLHDFAYRTSIGPETVVLAGAAALGLAVVTVGYQAVRAAAADPVRSLRHE